jgi:hypothetical protein
MLGQISLDNVLVDQWDTSRITSAGGVGIREGQTRAFKVNAGQRISAQVWSDQAGNAAGVIAVHRTGGSRGIDGVSGAPTTLDVWHLVGAAGKRDSQTLGPAYDTTTYNAAGFRKYPDGRVALRLVKDGTVGGNIPIFTCRSATGRRVNSYSRRTTARRRRSTSA